MNISVI